jgi:hypothetical protein
MPALKFRVLLDSSSDSEVFRDIVINDNESFESFFEIILESFELANNQMASFFVSDHEWNKGDEITLMDMGFDEENPPEIMSESTLLHYIESPKQRFILVYDFLNMWMFLVELQEILDETVDAPSVTFKVGKVPEELQANDENKIQDINFTTDKLSDFDDFDDFDASEFENIDDLDI